MASLLLASCGGMAHRNTPASPETVEVATSAAAPADEEPAPPAPPAAASVEYPTTTTTAAAGAASAAATATADASTADAAAPPPWDASPSSSEPPPTSSQPPSPPQPAGQRADFSLVPVFFATNRATTAEAEGAERRYANRAGPLSYGKLAITVPRRHVVGHIERPGEFEALFRNPNPRRHFTIRSFTSLDRRQVLDEIARQMAAEAGGAGGRQALIFVHGFNVRFDDAAFRTAQMAHDMKFRGAPVFYSWPSAYSTARYPHDASRIEESRPYIKAFIADVIARAGADHAYIIAHSMGTRGVSRAIVELSQERPEVTRKIAALILAAPDINATVFRNDIAPHLTRMARNVTLYASAEDVALAASYRVNGARALGDARGGMRVFPGMDSIDATTVGTSFLRHSEYGDSPFLLNDIAQVMQGRRPAERMWLRPRPAPPGVYEFDRVR